MFAEKFDQAKLFADARAIDGLEDFGDPVFYRPLEILLKDLAQAPLNKLGANILSAGIVRSLANRLRLNAWFSRHPCLLYTSPSPRDMRRSRMPSSA